MYNQPAATHETPLLCMKSRALQRESIIVVYNKSKIEAQCKFDIDSRPPTNQFIIYILRTSNSCITLVNREFNTLNRQSYARAAGYVLMRIPRDAIYTFFQSRAWMQNHIYQHERDCTHAYTHSAHYFEVPNTATLFRAHLCRCSLYK